jgi:uncharacterized protein YndB with AHSA1/START domain
MGEVKVSTVISAPCEDVFDLVSDLSRRPGFTDHYLKDFRLARPDPQGIGASARFLLGRRLFGDRAEIRITECDRPRRIVEEGRLGRRGRSSLSATYEFEREDGGCRVELTTRTEAKTGVDRLRHRGLPSWLRRHTKKSLDRLRRLLEEPTAEAPEQVTVAAYEPHTAPRFGDHVRAPRKTTAGDG